MTRTPSGRRTGRADLHIHTVASDGTAGGRRDPRARGGPRATLDVIAITDHERIDAALAARAIAVDRGLPVEVVVGEEVTTRGGHLLALFIEERIRPYRSLRDTIAAVHDAGGLAVPAHPLVPYPLCAQGFVLRGLLDDPDPRVHPDALETFNPTALGRPWHQRVVAVRRRARARAARQQRRPCPRGDRDGLDGVPRPDRRGPPRGHRAPARPHHHGSFHGATGPARHVRAPAAQARSRRPRRDRRPAPPRRDRPRPRLSRWPPAAAPLRARADDEDRPGLPVHLPGGGWRRPARPVPVREPAPRRARRPDHHRQPRPAALVRGRHPAHRRRVLDADERLGRDADVLAALHRPGQGAARARAVRPPPLPRAVRAVPLALPAPRVPQRQHRHVPRLRRVLAVVRVRQPRAARAMPPGSTAGSRSAPRPATSSTGSSPATTRSCPTASTSLGSPARSRSPAGRTGRRTCCSSVATSRARACSTCSRPSASCARPGTGRDSSSSAAGRRSARRAATWPPAASRASSSSAASRTPRRPSSTGRRRSSCRRRPAASRSASCSSRRWRPAPRSCARTSTATRASSVAIARASSSRRASPRSSPMAIARLLDDPALRASMSDAGTPAGGGVQLAARDGQGRAVLRLRHPPPGRDRAAPGRVPRRVPQAPPAPREGVRVVRRAPAPASDSLQTQAE